jgi:DeoR/GlpR family transcriptional regulator of sugar metabolism
VFPHRRGNPISVEKLREVISTLTSYHFAPDEFETILKMVAQRNLIPGLVYDGYEIFLLEEHASWKAEIQHQNKLKIGRRVASMIDNGMKVLLDAGSTTEEVVKIICTKIENRALTRVTIATTSVNIADMISDCCVTMGFDDDFSAVRLFIPGGQIRPSTQAIVPAFEAGRTQLAALSSIVGGFDLGIVGVNGVDLDGALTTHANAEATNKRDILDVSNVKVIVGDSSKIGIRLESKFADLADDIRYVVDGDPENQNILALAKEFGEKLILV